LRRRGPDRPAARKVCRSRPARDRVEKQGWKKIIDTRAQCGVIDETFERKGLLLQS
jgi:hypothetical protein